MNKDDLKYNVYILRTSANTFYIGQTNNLERRIKEHLAKNSKSSRYVRYFESCELVYNESHNSRSNAMKREAQLKTWPRLKKEN